MSEQSERVTSNEDGEIRLPRFFDEINDLHERAELADDLWAFDELVKSGRLRSQMDWKHIDILREHKLQDLVVDAAQLTAMHDALVAKAVELCRQSTAIELSEMNTFLLRNPGLFVKNDDSRAALVGLTSSADERKTAAMFADETAALIEQADLLIDMSKYNRQA